MLHPAEGRLTTELVPLRAPAIFAKGQWWPRDVVDLAARRLHRSASLQVPPDAGVVAIVVARSVTGIAAALAATALRAHVVLLPPDPRSWSSDPPIPTGTSFLLTSDVAHLVDDVKRAGGNPVTLTEDPHTTPGPIRVLGTPGMMWFTSGSTGLPKPVFRPREAVIACVEQRMATLPLADGAGVISGDSLAHGQGFIEFLLACRTGGPFAQVDPLNARSTLAVLAMPEFTIWFTSAQMADVLSRCPTDIAPAAPPYCFIAGGTSRRTATAFASRFGRVLRQQYGSSEGGPIAIDAGADDAVRPDTVGRVVHGVDVRIGDDPRMPLPAGEAGRIWIRSAAQSAGYGFPPRLTREGVIDGWTPTADLGVLDDRGYLALVGRMDDCIRVREGRLVNLALVASRLREAEGVREAVALPIETASGLTFGALVESAGPLDAVRRHLTTELPPWCWPRTVGAVEALPRLANGKVDRRACVDLLKSIPA